MSEKRKFERFGCKIKTKFEFYEGNPDLYDPSLSSYTKSKGMIFDISQGGLFIVTDERVTVAMPIIVNFPIKNKKLQINAKIVRTGLLKNNPSEIALKFKKYSSFGDAYIAIEFNEPLDSLRSDDI